MVKEKRYVHKAVARTHISIYHKFLTASKFWFPKILNRMGGKVEKYCQAFQARFSRPCTKQNRHYSKKVRGIVYTRKKFWGKVDRINDAQNWQPLDDVQLSSLLSRPMLDMWGDNKVPFWTPQETHSGITRYQCHELILDHTYTLKNHKCAILGNSE